MTNVQAEETLASTTSTTRRGSIATMQSCMVKRCSRTSGSSSITRRQRRWNERDINHTANQLVSLLLLTNRISGRSGGTGGFGRTTR